MREDSGLPTLRQRKIDACDKFAEKCIGSERFKIWFPESKPTRRRSRHTLPYQELHARCDRLRNSPLYYMRRRMNGKAGKTYGRRNEEYRNTWTAAACVRTDEKNNGIVMMIATCVWPNRVGIFRERHCRYLFTSHHYLHVVYVVCHNWRDSPAYKRLAVVRLWNKARRT